MSHYRQLECECEYIFETEVEVEVLNSVVHEYSEVKCPNCEATWTHEEDYDLAQYY